MEGQQTPGAAQADAGAGQADAGNQNPAAGSPPAGGQTPPDGEQTPPAGGQQDAPWYQAFPENTHESLKGFETIDDAMAAAERGKGYKPAKDVSEFDIQFAAGNEGSEAVIGEYSQFCMENGITPEQAQKLVSWQEGIAKRTNDALVDAGTTELKGRWGDKYEENKQQGLVALQFLDRQMDGRLSPALARTGLANDPVVAEALYVMSKSISEASLGGGSPGGGGDKEVEPIDTFKDIGFK